MSNLTDVYLKGAQSFNHFFSMVYQAMIECMPEVEISGSGAWVWRGYRIDSYKNLAKGLFYCQIYTHDPNILMFKESYKNEKYKSLDPLDIKYKIKDGGYYHPFWSTLNLFQSRFFLLKTSEQYDLIRNFVSYASKQALIWQDSETRSRPDITSKKYLSGNEKIQKNILSVFSEYDRVTSDYLKFIPMQNDLFSNLIDRVKIKLDGNYKWLRPNAHWMNWDFRGYRLKIFSGDSADFVWKIYYEKPENLVAISNDDKNKKESPYFDIKLTEYFDKNNEEQNQLLDNFIQYSLVSRIKNF